MTLKQIADATGVSTSTISRVLNFDATLSVSDQTRQSIIETAAAMNYEPPRRRKLTKQNGYAGKVALLHYLRPEEELTDPYYVSLRIGIESRCAALGVGQLKFYYGEQRANTELLNQIGGVILIGIYNDEEISWVTEHNKNVVIVDYSPPSDEIDAVNCDLVAATRKLLSALEKRGYQRISFVGWNHRAGRSPTGPETRYLAYRDWMRERGMDADELSELSLQGDSSEESGHKLTLSLLSAGKLPEILVTANDNMAVGAYRALAEKGLRIPEDIAVASFNDISAARFLNPPLTTVRLPAERIGENAVDLLLERQAGRQLAKRLTLETKIIWRGSTKELA